MQDDHEDISKLLRLKRYEQPSPEYFETFLRDFKDRQRAQLLREPAWRIAWDRLCAYFGEQLPSQLGYGLASTAVLIAAGIASMNILESRPIEVASVPEPSPAQEVASVNASVNPPLNLNPQVQLPDLPQLAHTASFTTPPMPRYVMDARPVSYEPPSSF
jgi:hypothetical protein